jgi:serine phosphatase RsbU (regulator of sigma subunit)
MYRRLASGESDVETLEKRYRRKDGSTFWGKCVVALIRDAEGRVDRYVTMVEDINERKEKLLRAAQVQRDLLPDSTPDIPGYELTGLCRPTEEVGGDFFDWYEDRPGSFTLTLGDVMGKGMSAAILMATMRVALRSSAQASSVGKAIEWVADLTFEDLERAETFMTMFHARIDLETGLLTYVDAGHGLAVIVGKDRAVPVRSRSMPLGVLQTPHPESSVTLRPGEALVVFSDGVLDVHPQLEGSLEWAAELLDGAQNGQQIAERLSTNPEARIQDDVTVVALRRLATHGTP